MYKSHIYSWVRRQLKPPKTLSCFKLGGLHLRSGGFKFALPSCNIKMSEEIIYYLFKKNLNIYLLHM